MRIQKIKKDVLLALKIAVGSSIAIISAEALGLQFASSAGIVTLLSVFTSKWATLKISLNRLISFVVTVALAWTIFMHLSSGWITYGLFMFFLLLISYIAGWKECISVNAVIGTHFWTTHDFSIQGIWNELMLVVIGITVAILVNLYSDNRSKKKKLIADIQSLEEQLRAILSKLSAYLRQQSIEGSVWEDICQMDAHLEHSLETAFDYRENSFVSHPEYYIHYVEMRTKQCDILHNLHYEMKKIRTMPDQAHIIADYIDYLIPFMTELNVPEEQLHKLHELTEEIRQHELPHSREEFEGQAMLYHILMDLEELLIYKKRFVETITEQQKLIYWGTNSNR